MISKASPTSPYSPWAAITCAKALMCGLLQAACDRCRPLFHHHHTIFITLPLLHRDMYLSYSKRTCSWTNRSPLCGIHFGCHQCVPQWYPRYPHWRWLPWSTWCVQSGVCCTTIPCGQQDLLMRKCRASDAGCMCTTSQWIAHSCVDDYTVWGKRFSQWKHMLACMHKRTQCKCLKKIWVL